MAGDHVISFKANFDEVVEKILEDAGIDLSYNGAGHDTFEYFLDAADYHRAMTALKEKLFNAVISYSGECPR